MNLKTRLLQGLLVGIARRSAAKAFDPVNDRARGAKLEQRFKPAKGVVESEVTLGVPCRRFTYGGGASGAFLHLHGGGCTKGSSAIGRLYTDITAAGGPDIVSVDYRLAPEHPFPAAVDDALAVYNALLETVPAHQLVVGGESAGGNLTLALVQRLVAEDMPLPVAIVAVYPWSDLTHTSASWAANGGRDVLIKQRLDHCSRAYAGTLALDDPRVSPQFGSFAGFPPALIPVGTRDCLLEDARSVDRAIRETGGNVTLTEYADAVHGFTVLPTRESKAAMAEIRAFVLGYLRAPTPDPPPAASRGVGSEISQAPASG